MAENQNREVYRNENLEQGNNSDRDKSGAASKKKNKGRKGSSETATLRNTSTEGYGGSHRKDDTSVGPLDVNLNPLPSEPRTSGDNQAGPGLG